MHHALRLGLLFLQAFSKDNSALGKLAVLLLLLGAVDLACLTQEVAVSNKVEKKVRGEKDHVGKQVAMEKGNKSEAQ